MNSTHFVHSPALPKNIHFSNYLCKKKEQGVCKRVGEWYDKANVDSIEGMEKDNKQTPTTNELILYRLAQIETKFDDFTKTGSKQYVTQDQFDPIRRLVYGCVGLFLSSVIIGLLALVINKGV